MSEGKLRFGQLYVGDRFKAYGELWTVIGPDAARKHPKECIALGEKSYGYIGSSICDFDRYEDVEFVPVDSWQPIALAPKDGTRVLLCSNTRQREIARWKQSHRPLEPSGWFTDAGWWVSNATHFQFLPEPPKE